MTETHQAVKKQSVLNQCTTGPDIGFHLFSFIYGTKTIDGIFLMRSQILRGVIYVGTGVKLIAATAGYQADDAASGTTIFGLEATSFDIDLLEELKRNFVHQTQESA